MHATMHHVVPARELTDAAFAPFGEIIKPRRGYDQFDTHDLYDPATYTDHVRLIVTNGEPCLRIMHLKDRGLVFTKMGRHRRVTQCLGSLGGKEWFLGFARPGDLSDTAQPALEDVVAFRIPGDRIIKMHIGTWHAGPHFTHDECLFLNLENEDTNRHDFQVADLPRSCRIDA